MAASPPFDTFTPGRPPRPQNAAAMPASRGGVFALAPMGRSKAAMSKQVYLFQAVAPDHRRRRLVAAPRANNFSPHAIPTLFIFRTQRWSSSASSLPEILSIIATTIHGYSLSAHFTSGAGSRTRPDFYGYSPQFPCSPFWWLSSCSATRSLSLQFCSDAGYGRQPGFSFYHSDLPIYW